MAYEILQGGVLYKAALFAAIWAVCVIVYGLYNLYIHPLRSYPGPILWRAYRLPYTISNISGNCPFDLHKFHQKYGPVVRVGPNDLSYTDSRAFKEIYGHHKSAVKGYSEFDKDRTHYIVEPNGVHSILSAYGPDHSRFRRLFSYSFSEKGMREMQPRIQHYVDLLITNLKQTSGYIDLLEHYNWLTFDIIGDLAFGEPFYCLENSTTHPWISSVFGNVKAVPYLSELQSYGLLWLFAYLTPKSAVQAREENYKRGREQIDRRIQLGTDRGDFWDKVIEKSDFGKGTGMTKDEMVSNAQLLVLGGSETTATLLSGATYLLLKNPAVLKKLNEEVRGSFKDEKEIDLLSVGKLDYMLAVFDEAMRLYPPVPHQGPRIVPSSGAEIAGKWVPGGTSVRPAQYASNRNPSNFHRPNDFIPERWLANPPPEFVNDDRAARAPFSLGPRNCIGMNLAYAEMRLVLARLCYNFDLELDGARSGDWIGEQKIFTLWEKQELFVRLKGVRRS